MECFRKVRVHEMIHLLHCNDCEGCKVVSTRWLDIKKGDMKTPNYRATLVGRNKWTQAATSLLDAPRLMGPVCVNLTNSAEELVAPRRWTSDGPHCDSPSRIFSPQANNRWPSEP